MKKQDREEFIAYLRVCTDKQVFGVLEKEQQSSRKEYIPLVKAELERRGLT